MFVDIWVSPLNLEQFIPINYGGFVRTGGKDSTAAVSNLHCWSIFLEGNACILRIKNSLQTTNLPWDKYKMVCFLPLFCAQLMVSLRESTADMQIDWKTIF